MQEKRNLLIVGDFNRKDFVEPFYACKQDFNFFFIEFASGKEIVFDYYKEYGQAIFWKDFSDAYDLLRKIKPCKVVFYFLESYNHIALNVACKALGIKTYHLDHAIQDIALLRKLEETRMPVQPINQNNYSLKTWLGRITGFKNKLKTRLFFINTIRKSAGEAKEFLKQYYQTRKHHTVSDTFQLINSRLRVADAYISYCPANFQHFVKQDHLEPSYPVYFIGVPVFDKWAHVQPAPNLKDYLVLIPQPFAEQGWLGWSVGFEKKIIQELVSICQQKKYKLFVKLHPYQNVSIWQEFSENGGLTLLSEEDLEEIIPYTKIILGYYSTLLIPMAALPHTTVFSLENHPVRSVIPAAFLTRSGVSYQLNSVNDLAAAIDNRNVLFEEQVRYKVSFAAEWLFRFDGKAGERLRKVLLRP